ncbi:MULTISPECIES: zinc metalloprotease [Catenuloplanes]|uniref:Uncharacterized protein n=1 Tax=Catenuloplanes niger TaxID=587534 RepID=A0AAE4CQE8_9ACTN|nr:hypothetical protein [Catenuloplanes niger]MDR7320427.1 hypothetical protein [Catenuloplanes niger]
MIGASATPASAAAPAPRFTHLVPGGQPNLVEKVPVNVVFLGFDRTEVDQAAFTSGLARTYEPEVTSRRWYGEQEKLGIRYIYDYKVSYTDRGYEDRFFRKLSSLATPAPLTEYQETYNAQERNVLDVTDNHYIDAPTVEKYLAFNPPHGVDTRRNTVFLINWYGRADFKFHVYTKTGEPDPDTGFDFGANRDSRKLMAWGGTTADDEETGLGATRRVWFADLSAGPDANMTNFIVDEQDVDGDGEPDYRLPTSWEYADGGFRAPGALAGDLAKLTRFVALDLLMTTSPIYPVELPARLPKSINLDSNTYEGWPGVDGSSYISADLLVDELSELRWRNRLDFDDQDLPFDDRNRACYTGQYVTGEPCYPGQTLPPAANLYLYNLENLERTQDDAGRVDYELPLFNYVTEANASGLLGYADDNWVDGTASYVYSFLNPQVVAAGYGLTTTQIHEVGHHLGMHHPHDGWDSESATEINPTGDHYFAWVGDESNSMMSYIDVNWDFSQFDRDNSDRFLTAAYVEAANRLAADVLADPDARKATADLHAADVTIGLAKKAFAAHDYRLAYTLAEAAYDRVVRAAGRAGVDPASAARAMHAEAEAMRVSAKAENPHEFIDTLEPGSGPRSRP